MVDSEPTWYTYTIKGISVSKETLCEMKCRRNDIYCTIMTQVKLTSDRQFRHYFS